MQLTNPLRFVIGLIVILGGCIVYTILPARARAYDLAPEDAKLILAQLETPPLFSDPSIRLAIKSVQPNAIEWVLGDKSGTPARIVAQLDSAPNRKTVVRVTLAAPGLAQSGLGTLQEATIRNLYEAAMIEQIDAALTNRAFRRLRIAPETFIAMAANLGAISGQMDRAAQAHEAQAKSNIEKAYEAEARGQAPNNFYRR